MLNMSERGLSHASKNTVLPLVLPDLKLLKSVERLQFGPSQTEFLQRTVPVLLRICESIDFTT